LPSLTLQHWLLNNITTASNAHQLLPIQTNKLRTGLPVDSAEERAFEISHFCTFQTSVTLTLDWVVYSILSCITHRPLSFYTPNWLHSNWENFSWTDGRMDGWADGHWDWLY